MGGDRHGVGSALIAIFVNKCHAPYIFDNYQYYIAIFVTLTYLANIIVYQILLTYCIYYYNNWSNFCIYCNVILC